MKGSEMTEQNQPRTPRKATTQPEATPEATPEASEATAALEATQATEATPEASEATTEATPSLEDKMVAAMVAQARDMLGSVSRDVAALERGTVEVETAVAKYNAAKSDRAVNAIATPLGQMVKYANLTAARSQGIAITDPQHIALAADWDHVLGKLDDQTADMLAAVVAGARQVVAKLSTTLETLPIADYVAAAGRLGKLADQPYSAIPAVLVNAAAAAVAKWNVAATAYNAAAGMGTGKVGSKPPVPPAGGSGTGQGPENGVWARGHGGLYFRATCLVCGAIKRAGSNPSSFSHTMREHMTAHNGGITPVSGGTSPADVQLAEARTGLKVIWLEKAADMAEAETAPAWHDTTAWRLERVDVAHDDQTQVWDQVIAAAYQASQAGTIAA